MNWCDHMYTNVYRSRAKGKKKKVEIINIHPIASVFPENHRIKELCRPYQTNEL